MPDLVPPRELRRNRAEDPVALIDAAVWLIDHMCHHIGVDDLAGLDVLDFGCGTRFTQALVDRGVPVGRYVGVDAARPVIDFLNTNVHDRRLEYVHLDAQNDRYNPDGRPLAELTVPELEGRQFDLVCLFSVFTHLAPADYVAMLKLVRQFVKPDGRLFYTVFIDELTEGGHGHMDRVQRAIDEHPDDPRLARAVASEDQVREPPAFRDMEPERPLHVAMYSRRHALELIDGTGWQVLEIAPPGVLLQHHIVCSPVDRA